MIDEKKIKQAAIECADEYYSLDSGKDREETNREIFVRGAHWAINEFLEDLWHDASEEPRKNTIYLAQIGDCAFDTSRIGILTLKVLILLVGSMLTTC